MSEGSKIEWTDNTFNPWIGCQKVSPGCDHCYAETMMDHRYGKVKWGPHGERKRTAPANWRKPIAWDREAAAAGVRKRVFCASLADVFDNQVPPEWRVDLFDLIRRTPNLDWQLLTKRPENIAKTLPPDWGAGYPNVWLGTTVEDQKRADHRIPLMMDIPARVHFLSCEPLLGPILFKNVPGFNRVNRSLRDWWVIAGGESGPEARPSHPDWFRSLRDQCAAAGVPFLFKQHGEWLPTCDDEGAISYAKHQAHCWHRNAPNEAWAYRVGKKAAGRLLDGVEHNGFPAPSPEAHANG